MIVYAVLGSAPSAADRISIAEAGETHCLISFFDYPKSFTSLSQLNQTIQEKLNDRLSSNRRESLRSDPDGSWSSTIHDLIP